ncbi:MAG: nucleotidyltransferase domain-containing protein [Candidatus Aenigmarchaeota archaeon]|nr:nucleotidyltransferase domain-containing protein [Candidatus Aenigmarchaeota archaeon]
MDLEINKVVNELKKHRKIAAIILFGSFARGKEKPLSDIDIAVITKNPDKDMEAEISSFSLNIFDIVNFHRLPLYIQFEVLKYGKPLFVRDEEYFSEIKREVVKEHLEMSHLYERINRTVLS